jgi:uncharacterized cupredoxin-like copper-binding protein
MRRPGPRSSLLLAVCGLAVLGAACDAGTAPATPLPVAGTADTPRDVNLIAKDYTFLPSVLDLVPGETIVLHVINGGLEVHEAVLGEGAIQDAWEGAEAGTVGAPPGPTPVVSVPPDVAGIRVVVRSGERVDVRWTVPTDVPVDLLATTPPDPAAWLVGCHIPGHWAQGMWIPIRWVVEPGSDNSSQPAS